MPVITLLTFILCCILTCFQAGEINHNPSFVSPDFGICSLEKALGSRETGNVNQTFQSTSAELLFGS